MIFLSQKEVDRVTKRRKFHVFTGGRGGPTVGCLKLEVLFYDGGRFV